MSIQFVIHGNPISKGRPRFNKKGWAYTDKKTKDAEVNIMVAATKRMKESLPYECPLMLSIKFYMPIPKSYSNKIRLKIETNGRTHSKRPDLDNLIKLVLDALNGICWIDDSQIIMINAIKMYAADNEPRTEVTVKEWETTHANPPYKAKGVSKGSEEDEIGDLIG